MPFPKSGTPSVTLHSLVREGPGTARTPMGGARIMPIHIELRGVRFNQRDIGNARVRLDCSIDVIVRDVDTGGLREMAFSHYVDWDRPETDEGWAMLEAEAYAATMRFLMSHELAETVRCPRDEYYVHPHPSALRAGCWEREMQSLEEKP